MFRYLLAVVFFGLLVLPSTASAEPYFRWLSNKGWGNYYFSGGRAPGVGGGLQTMLGDRPGLHGRRGARIGRGR